MITMHAKIPTQSALTNNERLFHYIDSFSAHVTGAEFYQDINVIARLFLTQGPSWAEKLMKFRNIIARLIGLKTSTEKFDDVFQFEVGKPVGIFKLYSTSKNEIVLGEDDKHLCFRVSILSIPAATGNSIYIAITTAVEFKNFMGRLYFLPVKPFHKLILRETFENMIKVIEE